MTRSEGVAGGRRARWEEQWGDTEASKFSWYVDGPPQQLLDLIEGGLVPGGSALDLGCGDGIITAYLAETFDPTIGVEFSLEALRQAQKRAIDHASPTLFAAAEVPALPFKTDTFAFVFDRGCAQNIPKELWATYFQAVEDVLIPGGILQFMASRLKRTSSGASLRARIRNSFRSDPHGHITETYVRSCLPSSLETLTLEPFEFQMSTGEVRRFVHGIFRKPS